MKVMLVNGSPHQNGCTFTALSEVSDTLRQEGIDSDIYWIGNKPIGGCIGCFQCAKMQKCIFDDKVNEFTKLAAEYDGFIFGSPVYFSGMNGNLMSFMDRAFFSASAQEPHPFRFKPAAAVVSARRAGTTSTLDQMKPRSLPSRTATSHHCTKRKNRNNRKQRKKKRIKSDGTGYHCLSQWYPVLFC